VPHMSGKSDLAQRITQLSREERGAYAVLAPAQCRQVLLNGVGIVVHRAARSRLVV